MGTTAVICLCLGNKAFIYNIGDSRCYVVKSDGITQVSIDHSVVQNMIESGELDKESGRNHPQKNIITRALGPEENAQFDCFEVDLAASDVILLCSDGLTNMLKDEEILEIVNESGDIISTSMNLSKKAKESGGHDNISVVLIEYGKEGI